MSQESGFGLSPELKSSFLAFGFAGLCFTIPIVAGIGFLIQDTQRAERERPVFQIIGLPAEPVEIQASEPAAPADGADAPPSGAPSAPAPGGEGAPAAVAAGGKPEDVSDAFWAKGKASFVSCAACHGQDGKGLQAGPVAMAPTLVGSELLLAEDPNVPLLVVLKGIQKEGAEYMGLMASLAASLDDEQIASVLTYARNSFGNAAPAITTEQAAAARTKFESLDAPAGIKRDEVVKMATE